MQENMDEDCSYGDSTYMYRGMFALLVYMYVCIYHIAENFQGGKFSRMAPKIKFLDKIFTDTGFPCRTTTQLCPIHRLYFRRC